MSKLKNIKPQPRRTGGYAAPAVIRRNQPETPPPGVWSGEQAAAFFGLCYRSFMKLVRTEGIPYRKLGRRYLFSKSVLERWLDAEINPAENPRNTRTGGADAER
jgi:excisionase family DNA binding protein